MPNPINTVPEVDLSWEALQRMADLELMEMVIAHKRAPIRSRYNKLIGGYSTSKRDIVRACKANLDNLNLISQAKYGKDVVTFVEEDQSIPKITINKEGD